MYRTIGKLKCFRGDKRKEGVFTLKRDRNEIQANAEEERVDIK